MSRTADDKRYFTWRQRRRNRFDLAVLATLVQGHTLSTDVRRCIGGSRSQVSSALTRLVRAGLVNVVPEYGGWREDAKYVVTEWWLTHPYSYDSDLWR